MEPDRTRYRPGAKRYPLYENDERDGSCEHDGDCLRPHCNKCISRARVPAPHPCPLRYGKPPYATFCGCVQKRCSWFTQTLVLKRLTSIEGLTVHFAGEKVTDAKVVSRGAELLKEQLDLRPCYKNFAHLLPVRHRFVVTTVGTYGATDARVTGAAPRLQRCIDDAFGQLLFAPNEISERFPNTKELQITGVAKVYMGYGVGADW